MEAEHLKNCEMDEILLEHHVLVKGGRSVLLKIRL